MKRLLALLSLFAIGSALAAQQVFDLALIGGRVASDHGTIRVAKGDDVVLRCTSDRAIALHLHGYDIEASIPAGGSATIHFLASIPGRFPVSEHGHGKREKAVLYVEVLP